MSLRTKTRPDTIEVEQSTIDRLTEEIRRLTTRVAELRGERDAMAEYDALIEERRTLREQIETLKIEQGRIDEEHARKLRDVEHATGLHRKQSEWERERAVKEAQLEVREGNLAADQTRFEEQMSFHREQIKGETDRLVSVLDRLMERLPVVTVEKTVNLAEERTRRGGAS